MIEATHRSGQFIYDYQTLIAGFFALIVGFSALVAAVVTVRYLRKQIETSVEEGKRERAFRMNQHDIKIQNKRRAVALMVASDMLSVVEIAACKEMAKTAKKHAEKLERLDDGESCPTLLFVPVDKTFLSNYSHYIENIPLMNPDTVREVSRLYIFATTLSEVITLSNATREGEEADETRANFLTGLSRFAEETGTQLDKTMLFLEAEVKEAKKELDRLKIVQEKLTAGAPSS